MLKEHLLQLGLTEKEIDIYLVLLQHGQMTPVSMARLTKINRTTIYTVVKELQKKGLVAEDKGQVIQTFVARPPESLNQVVRQEEIRIQKQKAIAAKAVEELSLLTSAHGVAIPRITFIEEDQILPHSYARAVAWNQSMLNTKTEYVGYFDYSLISIYEEWIDWYWKQPSSKDIHVRLLTNETEYEKEVMQKKLPKRRNIRFWDAVGELTFTTMINGDYTLLFQTREHPYYLIEIYDAAYAKSQRQIFEMMWGVALNANNDC